MTLTTPLRRGSMQPSHPAAIELADSIMVAVGGRKNWDATRFISWNFFWARDLVWDKKEGRVRIEKQPRQHYLPSQPDYNGRKGAGERAELTQADSVGENVDKAKPDLDQRFIPAGNAIQTKGFGRYAPSTCRADTLVNDQHYNVLRCCG